MNCIEVGDLMQRHLDLDLNEKETEQLLAHLTKCSDCKAMFERLSLLSRHLEQLPRVTPSISIVDSILPRLEEIDIAGNTRHQEKSTIENREELATVEKLPARGKKDVVKWLAPVSGLVAAAAILLTINAIDINKGNNSNSSMVAYDTASSTAEMADALSTRQFSADKTAPITEEGMLAPLSSGYLANPEDSSDSNYSVGQLKSSPFNGVEINEDEQETSQPQIERENNSNLQSNVVKETQPLKVNVIDQFGESTGLTEEMPTETPFSMLLSEHLDEIEQVQILEENSKFISPDEKVYFVYALNTITVYDFSSNEPINTFELSIEGTYRFLNWGIENKQINVEVLDGEGIRHHLSFSF